MCGIWLPDLGPQFARRAAASLLRLILLSWWAGWWLALEVIDWGHGKAVVEAMVAVGNSPYDLSKQYPLFALIILARTGNRYALGFLASGLIVLWLAPWLFRRATRTRTPTTAQSND